jgi:hypothetical protein
MTILYTVKNGRYSYRTDTTKPHQRNKSIGGFCYSLAAIHRSIETYLGHKNYELVECETMPNRVVSRQLSVRMNIDTGGAWNVFAPCSQG